jgi:hypothetical protein
MTQRERYRETLLFGNPDKIPFSPGGPREKTRARWHKEGLPEGANYMDEIYRILDFDPEPPQKSAPALGVDFRMIPQFEEEVLEHKDGHYIVRDWMGAITEISDEYDVTYIRAARDFVTRKWHRFPVQTRKDFEEQIKWRYAVDAPGRFPEDFEERCQQSHDRDNILHVHFNGPFWQMREWCGFEGLCTLMLDEPEFVAEMAQFWTDFVMATLQPILDRVELDSIGISEDMAYKSFSMISPSMARRFLQPSYEIWVPAIKASGCPIIDMDSDGFIGELIPIWIESGINVCDPIEVAAGNDINDFRQRFGKTIGYTGGIDKRAIAAGDDVMRDELLRVIPPMLKDGGYIPACDHGVPHDISWPNFIEYSRLLAQLTGWI